MEDGWSALQVFEWPLDHKNVFVKRSHMACHMVQEMKMNGLSRLINLISSCLVKLVVPSIRSFHDSCQVNILDMMICSSVVTANTSGLA